MNTEIRPGDIIIWKLPSFKDDILANTLSFILGLKDSSWHQRTWRGWHCGFVVNIDSATGEIVTEQGVNVKDGVCAVTYANTAAMGDCRIYHWLDDPDQVKISNYAESVNGSKYSIIAYPITIACYLFNWQYAVYNRQYTCWQNIDDFVIAMGKWIQPLWQMPLISKILTTLEGDSNARKHD